jgi:hypothetical protein
LGLQSQTLSVFPFFFGIRESRGECIQTCAHLFISIRLRLAPDASRGSQDCLWRRSVPLHYHTPHPALECRDPPRQEEGPWEVVLTLPGAIHIASLAKCLRCVVRCIGFGLWIPVDVWVGNNLEIAHTHTGTRMRTRLSADRYGRAGTEV